MASNPAEFHSTSRNFRDLYGDLPEIKARCSEIFRYTENSANLLKASLSFFARLAIFGNYSTLPKIGDVLFPAGASNGVGARQGRAEQAAGRGAEGAHGHELGSMIAKS